MGQTQSQVRRNGGQNDTWEYNATVTQVLWKVWNQMQNTLLAFYQYAHYLSQGMLQTKEWPVSRLRIWRLHCLIDSLRVVTPFRYDNLAKLFQDTMTTWSSLSSTIFEPRCAHLDVFLLDCYFNRLWYQPSRLKKLIISIRSFYLKRCHKYKILMLVLASDFSDVYDETEHPLQSPSCNVTNNLRDLESFWKRAVPRPTDIFVFYNRIKFASKYLLPFQTDFYVTC